MNKEIEDRIAQRFREHVANGFLEEQEIEQLIQKSIHKTFFQNRRKPSSKPFSTFDETEPLIHEIARELLTQLVKEEVEKFIYNNKDEIKSVISDSLQKSIGTMVLEAINSMFQYQLNDLRIGIESKIGELNG